jgi:hypothetical protein
MPAVKPCGTVKVAPDGILPEASVVKLNGTIELSNRALSRELGAKPVPETVTT